VEAAVPLVDLWLYDVKVIDEARHRELTGVGNARILGNLRWLAARVPGRIVIRVPFVPEATDDAANLEGIAALAVEVGIGRVALMPYHPMGMDKYPETGREPPLAYAIPAPQALMRAAAVFLARGLACEVE
jgi:pyruvate formate lyase activating enzyme